MDALIPQIYRELRTIAAAILRGERIDHTLQPTALVNEAYLRMHRAKNIQASDREIFLAVAAGAMRRIVVDHARKHESQKRGGRWRKIALEDLSIGSDTPDVELVALDEAMDKLASIDQRQHEVVELRYFGGMTNAEVAAVLGVSVRTVEEDWRYARMWLKRELSRGGQP